MHRSVLEFVAQALPDQARGQRVLEVGSRVVNGTVRPLLSQAAQYVGVDLLPGAGVDVVADAGQLPFGGPFDLVVSTEMLEHAEDWRGALVGLKQAVRPGGTLVLTFRGPGFPRHCPPDHWRFSAADARAMVADMEVETVVADPGAPGVFVKARQNGAGIKSPVNANPRPAPVGNAFFVASELFGGGMVRSFWPAADLAKHGWWTAADIGYPDPGTWWDVVVIHRPLAWERARQVLELKRAGHRVLVDEDDDLTHLAETNPDLAAVMWPPEREAAHDQAIRDADGLVVTTQALAEVYGPMAREVHVVPNGLPAWVGRAKFHRGRRDRTVRVGWAGILKTHRHDLEWLSPVARGMLEGATFSTVGDPRSPAVLGVPGRAETWPFQFDAEAMYRLMARADVGIVPLLPCPFNVAKSHLKALEYMTLGKPVVVTDLPEQRALVRDGIDGYLASTPEAFAEAVRALVGDPALRAAMGAAAKERAAAFTLSRMAGRWAQALLGVTVAS